MQGLQEQKFAGARGLMGKSVIDGQGPERRFPTPFLGLSLPLSLPPFLGICAFQSFF